MDTPVYVDATNSTGPTSWPAASGLAILVRLGRADMLWANQPMGWALKGTMYSYSSPWGFTYQCLVYTRQVPSSGAPSLPLPTPNYQRLIVVPNAGGVREVKSGVRSAVVPPNGGIVTVSDFPNDAAFAGMTLHSGLPQLVDFVTLLKVKTAWASSVGGGVVGVTSPWLFSPTQNCITVSVVPPTGPNAPTLVLPVGIQVSNAVDIGFSWVHNATRLGGKQDAYKLRTKLASGSTWSYWNAATSTWDAAEATNLSAVSAVSVPVAPFTTDANYQWQVMTREQVDGRWSGWSNSAQFTPVTPPSVSITSSASWSNDLTPTITFTPTTTAGRQKIAHRITVMDGAVTLHDSGWVPGQGTSQDLPVSDWLNGTAMTLSVWVQQTGGAISAPATQNLTLSWSGPSVPVVTPSATPPGITLEISVASALSGTRVEVQRQTTLGVWDDVLTADYPASGTLTVSDVLAPYGVSVVYRARAVRYLDGKPLISAWSSATSAVVCADSGSYLVDDVDSTLWLPVVLINDDTRTVQRPATPTYGMGDTTGVVDYGTDQGESGQMTLRTRTVADRATLRAWLVKGKVLVFRQPPRGGVHVPPRRLAVSGEITVTDLAQSTFTPQQDWSFPWISQ